jgi:large subunit ribosomal protein L22
MEIKAQLNYLRIAARKVRLVADLVRNMDVKEAEIQLKFMPKRASVPLLKLLNSATANAKNNFDLEKDILYIKKIMVNEGPPFKRWKAGSRGRANPITKKISHINLVLDVKPSFAKATEDKPGAKVEERKVKKPEPETVKPEKIEKTEEEERERPKYRAPKKIVKKPEIRGLFKKIFRRKSF